MKKLVNYVAIAATAALIPFTASALEPMSNAAKKELTGQAGVSIAIDDIKMETWTGETKYIDSESLDGTAGGAIVVGPSQVQTRIRGLRGGNTNSTIQSDLTSTYGIRLDGVDDGSFLMAQPLSINVGNCSIITDGLENNRQFMKDLLIMVSPFTGDDVTFWDVSYSAAKTMNHDDFVADGIDGFGLSYAVASGLYKYMNSEISDGTMIQAIHPVTGMGLEIQSVDADGDPIFEADGVTPVMEPHMIAAPSGDFTASDVIGVQIEVPTLVIETSGSTQTIGVAQIGNLDSDGNPTTLTAANHGQNFITIQKGPSVMALYSGRVEIAAH